MVVLSIPEAFENHRDDKDAAYGGVMPCFPSSDLCPVKSFANKYLTLFWTGSWRTLFLTGEGQKSPPTLTLPFSV